MGIGTAKRRSVRFSKIGIKEDAIIGGGRNVIGKLQNNDIDVRSKIRQKN